MGTASTEGTVDREQSEDQFADEPRRIGGKPPPKADDDSGEASPAAPGREAEEAAGGDSEEAAEDTMPSQEIEDPGDGEAPSG
jgi:hypothetical protein